MVERLFLGVPRGCLQFVIVVFPDHTHLLFFIRYMYGPHTLQVNVLPSGAVCLVFSLHIVPDSDEHHHHGQTLLSLAKLF